MALMDLYKKYMYGTSGMGEPTQGLFGTGGEKSGGLIDFNKMNNQQGGLLSNIPQSALLGASIFSQGIQGKDPISSLLPAITQTSQTSAFLDQMSQRKKSKEFVDKYKTTLPEGSTIRALMEANPDKAFDFIAKKELATLNAQGKRSTAYKVALEVGLTPGTPEFNSFIKAQTIKTDIAAQAMQQAGGSVISPGKRDELVKDVEFVSNISNQLDSVIEKIDADPTLAGGVGGIRKTGNKIGTLLKDFGVDVESFLPEGMGKEFIFDSNIPTINALENTIASGFAKVLYPGQKITNLQINEAKKVVKLTGLTGSKEVTDRLREVKSLMNTYVNSYQNLLDVGSIKNEKKRLKLNPKTGEFEEF